MGTIIFDLDGTLCDITHRLHYIKREKPDWPSFHAYCFDDTPKPQIINICHALKDQEYRILIVSGRNDSVRAQTIRWLEDHYIAFDDLILRPEGNHTPDDQLKEGWLKSGKLGDVGEIMCVFDDRQRVVDMWRRNGLTCLQVDKWDE